tara:strand:+ start:566 stop:922 length:357 start_codon:yes stop_codon:yes gene_type:complete
MPLYTDKDKNFLGSAINALVDGKSGFIIKNTSDGKKIIYENSDSDFIPPTDEEIEAKKKEFKDASDAIQYKRDRLMAYPDIGDQLDMLYHAIDGGALDKTSDFYKELKKVKDANPKKE